MKNKRKAGFTLVEMLVVVAIIGILSTTIYSGYQRYLTGSKINVAKAQFTSIIECFETAMVENQIYPRETGYTLNPENFRNYSELFELDLVSTFNYISDKDLPETVTLEVEDDNIIYTTDSVKLVYDTLERKFISTAVS